MGVHVCVPQDKRGAISVMQSPVLQRLEIDTETWLYSSTTFEDSSGPWVGQKPKVVKACENTGKH